MNENLNLVEFDAVVPNPNITPLIYNHILFKDGELKQFLKELSDVYNKFGLDSKLNIRDYLLAEMTFNFLAIVNNTIDKEFEMKVCNEPETIKISDCNPKAQNAEANMMEKLIEPKFKVGDKITEIGGSRKGEIFYIDVDKYHVAVSNIIGIDVFFEDQDDWELIPNKFDPKTLIPFDRVLVRDANDDIWGINLFERYIPTNPYPFFCIQNDFTQCIPYEGNEHLLGTTNDCNDFFKIWED